MSVAIGVTASIALSGLLALVVVRAPGIGVWKHPRQALVVAVLGAVVATATLAILIGAPVVFGMAGSEWWTPIVINYFLAAAHRIFDGPYPFFWTPSWMYEVGSLTPLIAFGASLALGAGYSARRRAPRTAVVIMTMACCLLAAYVVAGVFAAASTRGGVPL
jgi:hypothetical protein